MRSKVWKQGARISRLKINSKDHPIDRMRLECNMERQMVAAPKLSIHKKADFVLVKELLPVETESDNDQR
jgi:hypothetical protein